MRPKVVASTPIRDSTKLREPSDPLPLDLNDERLTAEARRALWSRLLVDAMLDRQQSADRHRFRMNAAVRRLA